MKKANKSVSRKPSAQSTSSNAQDCGCDDKRDAFRTGNIPTPTVTCSIDPTSGQFNLEVTIGPKDLGLGLADPDDDLIELTCKLYHSPSGMQFGSAEDMKPTYDPATNLYKVIFLPNAGNYEAKVHAEWMEHHRDDDTQGAFCTC